MARKRKTVSVALSRNDFLDGVHIAVAQSQRLYSDAKALLELGSETTAFALTVLAIEEAGKAVIIRNCIYSPDSRRSFRADYRDHLLKFRAGLYLSLIMADNPETLPRLMHKPIPMEEWLEIGLDVGLEMEVILTFREDALYTRYDTYAGSFVPVEIPGRELLDKLIGVAALSSTAIGAIAFADETAGQGTMRRTTSEHLVSFYAKFLEDTDMSPAAIEALKDELRRDFETRVSD